MPATIRIAGLTTVRKALSKTEDRARDLRPVFLSRIDPDVSRFFRARFESAGARGGGSKWRPLAHATILARLRGSNRSVSGRALNVGGGNRGGVGRPLWDSGILRSTFVRHVPGTGSFRRVTPKTYERGSTDELAPIHQEGTSTIPAREIVPETIDPVWTERWAGMIADYVAGGFA